VVALRRHPVKSLQGESLTRCAASFTGLRGDRHWAVRDVGTGTVLSAKRHPALLLASAQVDDGGLAVDAGDGVWRREPDADAALSGLLGRAVTLARAEPAGAPFMDAADLHLVTVAELGAADARRFRPNVVVDGLATLDDLLGATLSLGDVVVHLTSRTKRCSMTTAAQPGLPKDVDVLRHLARTSDLRRGVYARVVSIGMVGVGDAVEILDRPSASGRTSTSLVG
jgi:uncharacterized protein YcbX